MLHRLTQCMWNLQQMSYPSTPLFLFLESILECASKSDRIIELLILSFSKYLLNVYYMSGTVLGAGSKMINELDRALAL